MIHGIFYSARVVCETLVLSSLALPVVARKGYIANTGQSASLLGQRVQNTICLLDCKVQITRGNLQEQAVPIHSILQ